MRRGDEKNRVLFSQHTGFGVALETEHNFRCSVPSGSNIFRHVPGIFFRIYREATCEAKVANLEFAIGVDQQIAWLQIAVQHVGRVDVLETAQNLVDEGLEMSVRQGLAGSNNGRQVALHQLCIGWSVSNKHVLVFDKFKPVRWGERLNTDLHKDKSR